MFCRNCGTQLGDNAGFCSSCGTAQRIEAGTGGAAPLATTPVAYTPATGCKANTSQWIGQGWELVKADMGNFILVTVVMMVVNGTVPFVLQGALNAGFQGFCKRKLQGKKAEIGNLFDGFQVFVPALLASLVMAILVFCGLLFLIIPGIVVAAIYQFTYMFIIDKRMEFGQAMKASHAVVKQDYFGFTIFLIALGLVNVVGFLCLIVGLLVTIPLTLAASAVAYRDVVGFEP